MRRRDFIAVLGGAVAAWPHLAMGQTAGRPRRIAILMNAASENVEAQSYFAAFQRRMQELGWAVGGNLQIELRWGGNDRELWRRQIAEVIALGLDAIVPAGAIVFEVQRMDRTIPLVFPQSIDPVGSGVVASMARPGGNSTGFTQFDFNLAGKWVDLLREFSPNVKRIGVVRDARAPAGIGQWAIIQAASTASGIEALPVDSSDAAGIERGLAVLAQEPNGGVVVTVSSSSSRFSGLIISNVARHRLPTVYGSRSYVVGGGLMSYGTDLVSQYRRTAEYVDRILKGERPANLPVQAPTKYELVVNLSAAKSLGSGVPPTLLARADEVIE
jgi:putative ABC transport system substrate-binding protein